MANKIRLGYDILSKRAIETESGINIDEALRRKDQEIADINTAITNIEGDITNIQAVIPDNASSENKLITTDQVEQKISDVLSNYDLIYLDDVNGDDTNDGLTKNTSVRTIAGAIRAFKDAQENNSYFKTVKIYVVTETQETPIQIASDEDLSILTNYSNGIWLYGKSITLANTVGTAPLIVHYSLHIIAENVSTYITGSDDVSGLYLKVECVNYSGYCMTTSSIEIESSSNISLNGTSGPGDSTHTRPNMFLRSNGQIYVSSGAFYCNMVNMTAMESINVYGDIYVSYSYGLFRSLEGTVSFYKGLTAVDTNGNYLNVYIDSCYGVSNTYGITCGDLIINAGKKYSKIYNNTVNICAANYIYGDMIVKCHTFAPGGGAHMYHGNVSVKAEEINLGSNTFNIAGYAVFDSNTYYTGPSSMYVTKMIVNARNAGLSNTTSNSYSLFAYIGPDKIYSETESKYIFNIDSDNFYTLNSNIQNRNADVTINCKGKVYISDDGTLNVRSLDLKCRDLYIYAPVYLGFFNIDVENMIEMSNPNSNIYMRLIGTDSTTSDTVSYDTRYDNTLKCGSLYCSMRSSATDGSYGLIHTHYGNAVKNIDIQVGMLLCPSYNTTGAGGTMTPQVLGKCESGGHTFNSTISGHVGGYVGYNGPGTMNVSAWDHDIRQIPPSYGNVIIDSVPGSSNNTNGVITLKFDDVYETNHFYFDPDQGDDTLDGCTRQTAVKSVTALVHAIMKKTGGSYNSNSNYFSIVNPVSIHILSVCYGNNRNTNYNTTMGYVYAGLNDWMYNGGYNGDNTPNGVLFDLAGYHGDGGCRVQFNFLEFIPESPGMSLYARSFNASTLVAKGFRDIGLVGYGSGGFNYLEATGMVALNNSWSNGGYYYYNSRLGPLNISARDIVLYGWFNCLTAKAENSIHIIDTYGGDSTTSDNCCLYGLTTLEAEDIYLGEAFTYTYSSGSGSYTQYKIGLSGILNIRARNSIYCRVDTVDGLVFMDAGNQISGGFAGSYFRGQLHAKCLDSYLTSGSDSDYQTGNSYSYYSFSTYTAADRGGAGIIDIQASKQLIVSGWGTSGSGDCYLYGVDLYLKAPYIAGTSGLYLYGNNRSGKILVDGDELYIGLKPYYYNYIFIKSQHCATPQALQSGGPWTDTGGYTYINLDIGKLRSSIQLPTYVRTSSGSTRTYEITGRIGLMNNQVLYWGQTVDPDNPPTISNAVYNFSIVVGHVTNSGHGIDKTGWVPDNSGTVIVLNDQKALTAGQGINISDTGDSVVISSDPKSIIVQKPVTIDNGVATAALSLNRYNVIIGIDSTVTDLVIDMPVESTESLLTEVGFEFYLDAFSQTLNSVTFTNSTEQLSSIVPDEFTTEHIYQGVLVNRCITLVEYDRPDENVMEINGKKYRTVKIGEQTWMAENLADASSGVWYDNDQATYEPLGYGKLYTYSEASGISVSGWHLPTKNELENLISYCGGTSVAGGKIKSTTGWNSDGNGTDDYGLTAKPSGQKQGNSYSNAGFQCNLWSGTELSAGNTSYYLALGTNSTASVSSRYQTHQIAVRLVKDMSVKIGGRDYRVVQIGNQLWMAENLDWKFTGLNFRDSVNNPLDTTTAIQAAYYNYDESTYGVNGNKYGLLYNWYAVDYLNQHLEELGVPVGWHVPTITEWEVLVTACGSDNAYKLKSISGWNSGTCNDYYGFNAVPTGLAPTPAFYNVGSNAYMWTSTRAYHLEINTTDTIGGGAATESIGMTIRLVKNLT